MIDDRAVQVDRSVTHRKKRFSTHTPTSGGRGAPPPSPNHSLRHQRFRAPRSRSTLALEKLTRSDELPPLGPLETIPTATRPNNARVMRSAVADDSSHIRFDGAKSSPIQTPWIEPRRRTLLILRPSVARDKLDRGATCTWQRARIIPMTHRRRYETIAPLIRDFFRRRTVCFESWRVPNSYTLGRSESNDL